jgi:Arc/MetJ family transcription regulator
LYNAYIDVYQIAQGGEFMRTNVVIDDELMSRAMEISKIKTKKEIVNTAIAEFVERRAYRDLSELRGQIKFAEGYDYKAARGGRFT